ncbi:MAG: winged helix-turn-helix transcriptional regulator [Bacteroidetes bacterium]|jgi:DNA-binding MarR family transcriptional regulator|nr:winged helix-turn-helix transcriptional regulator [Bacteroidota bacterium]
MAKQHTETIDSKLKSAWQIISRMYNAEAAQYGGSIAIGHFLLNIDSHEGSYASDIAPKLGMESTSLSRIIKTLEDDKQIVRKADKADKRKVKILLTQKGKENKELAKNIVRNFNTEIETKLGKTKIDDFLKTINEIIQLAEERNKLIKQ